MSLPFDKMTYQEVLAATAGQLGHLDHFRILVLNADYNPFSVIPISAIGWREAVVGVITEKYDVVAEYQNVAIRSPSISVPLPSIVAVKKYQKPEQTLPFSKKNIFLRDNYTCQYCSKHFSGSELTFDHVIPRSKGGGTDWYNIVSACDVCNRKKGNSETWVGPSGKKGPIHKPYKPDYFDLANKMKKRKLIIPEKSGWEEYLNWEGPLFIRNSNGSTFQISGPECEPVGVEALGY